MLFDLTYVWNLNKTKSELIDTENRLMVSTREEGRQNG